MHQLPRYSATVLLTLCVCASTVLAGLRDDVDRLIRNSLLKGATVAVSVRECGSGAALVSVNADQPMTPASNMKLLTSGAALHALGPDFEFKTRLVRRGERLIVIGDGDPGFGDPELLKEMTLHGQRGVDIEALVNLWVNAVVEADIKSVSDVVVDDRIFDRETALRTWPGDEPNRYCPQVSGLNFYGNVVEFFPKPRKGQSPQPPDIGPSRPFAPWLKITNAASSRDGAKDKNDLWIARKLNSNDFTFRGNVRFAYRTPVAVNVHQAPEFFSHVLAHRLAKAGIKVGGFGMVNNEDLANGGDAIGPVICTPISTALRRCNRNSDNLYAECLLKRIGFTMTGEPGSWINGTAVIRHIVLQRLSDPDLASGVVIVDGSGLSAGNKVTARAMTAWLNTFANDDTLGPILIESLAVGGQSGTLTKRMPTSQLRGAVVHAKTGYINQVSCLSGFVTMPDGRRRSFSVLVNGLKEGPAVAKALQDQIVIAIAADMASTTVTLGSD